MQDGENILGEFLLGAVIRVVENHDPAAVLFGKPLDELESEPVSVGWTLPKAPEAMWPASVSENQSRRGPDCLYPSFISISPESVLVDSKLLRSFATWNVWHDP